MLFLMPLFSFGASKEIVELQRDVDLLQDQVRTLQRALDEKTAALQTLVQQTLDSANKSNSSMAVLQSTVGDKLKEQEKSLVSPVASLGAKVDQVSGDVQALKESGSDMNSKMAKLQQMIVDLGNIVRACQTPAPLPPSAAPSGPPTPPPGTSAESLYNGAMKDQMGGNYDLALKEFTDYLSYFGTTEMAPNAQFHIGEILNHNGDSEGALKAFDAVLEKYPNNNKTCDAMLMKGMVLEKTGQRNDGAKEFRELLVKCPNTEQAAKARAELKRLGLSAGPAPAATKKRH